MQSTALFPFFFGEPYNPERYDFGSEYGFLSVILREVFALIDKSDCNKLKEEIKTWENAYFALETVVSDQRTQNAHSRFKHNSDHVTEKLRKYNKENGISSIEE
jgi:hypothetical protein